MNLTPTLNPRLLPPGSPLMAGKRTDNERSKQSLMLDSNCQVPSTLSPLLGHSLPATSPARHLRALNKRAGAFIPIASGIKGCLSNFWFCTMSLQLAGAGAMHSGRISLFNPFRWFKANRKETQNNANLTQNYEGANG